jgi:hypothetical protein
MSRIRLPYVWFSDKLFLRRTRTPGWILTNLAQENGIKVDESKVNTVFTTAYNSPHHLKTLFNPHLFQNGEFDSTRHYKQWLEDIVDETVNGVNPLFMGLQDVGLFKHKAVLRLMHRKYIYLNEDLRKLLIGLQQHKVPFGIIANEGPHVKSFFRHMGRIELEYSPFVVRGLERIPIINAMDDGYAKPQSRIFKRAVSLATAVLKKSITSSNKLGLPILDGDQYFIGSDPSEDIITNGQGFNLKSVLVTSALPEPVSDIKHLNTADAQSLQSFRISDISEIYRVFFGNDKATYYLTNDLFHITDSPLLFTTTVDEQVGSKVDNNIAHAMIDKHSSIVPGLDSTKEGESSSISNSGTAKPNSNFSRDKNLNALD